MTWMSRKFGPEWWVLALFAAFIAIGIIGLVCQPDCVRYERQWVQRAPTYVKVGYVLLPVEQPAGYELVCVEYED